MSHKFIVRPITLELISFLKLNEQSLLPSFPLSLVALLSLKRESFDSRQQHTFICFIDNSSNTIQICSTQTVGSQMCVEEIGTRSLNVLKDLPQLDYSVTLLIGTTSTNSYSFCSVKLTITDKTSIPKYTDVICQEFSYFHIFWTEKFR